MIKFIKYILGQILLLPLFSQSWDDVLFAHRNKMYGAYELRRLVAKNQFIGLVATLAFFIALFTWLQFGNDNAQEADFQFEKLVEFKGFDANLITVQPLKKEQAPPEITKPEEEVVEEEKKDLPPEVKEDKPVKIVETKKTVNVDSIVKATEKAGQDTGKKYVAGLDSGIVQPKYEEGQASPLGGWSDFNNWISQNLNCPKDVINSMMTPATVEVFFNIDVDGVIKDVKVLKGFNLDCDNEVIRVIKTSPKWKPRVINGVPVKQRFKFSVKVDPKYYQMLKNN